MKDIASYEQNKGSISFTYETSGLYGAYINECRLSAWELAINRNNISLDGVCDVGCSYGAWDSNWKRLGFERLYRIDGNEEVIREANERFDEVKCCFSGDLHKFYPKNKTIAANGVVIHILKESEIVNFFKDISKCLSEDGIFVCSFVDAKHYKGKEGYGSNGCSYFLSRYKRLITKADLKIVDEIGTFIKAPGKAKTYKHFLKSASDKRNKDLGGFAEVLLVMKRGRGLA